MNIYAKDDSTTISSSPLTASTPAPSVWFQLAEIVLAPATCGSRYTHSREYLEAVCRDAGFRVLVVNNIVLRKNAGVPVRGFVFITEAVGAAAPTS